MKKLIIVLLAAEFVIAYLVVGSGCILRQAEVRAFAAWHDNPTPATRAEFDRQKRITEIESLTISGMLFCGMAGVTLVAARAWSRGHKVKQDLRNEKPVA
jgi:hypothetical protein